MSNDLRSSKFKLIVTRDVEKKEHSVITGKLTSFKFGEFLGDLNGTFKFKSGFTVEINEFPKNLSNTLKSMGLAVISNATIDLTDESVSINTQ